MLAIAHRSRNGAVIPHGDKRLPAQNTGDGHHVGYRVRLWLIQLLRPALASLPPPRGGCSCGAEDLDSWFAQSLLRFARFRYSLGLVYILFIVGLHIVWTKFCLAHKNAFIPARGVVVQAIDQGAVAVHEHRPTLIVLSCLSSPGNGTGAPPAQTSTCPGWARNRRYLITVCSLMYSESFSLCFFGSNSFANCSKPIVKACILTSMQRMSHPVRSLSPPPEIALKSVCHATLCFPAC